MKASVLFSLLIAMALFPEFSNAQSELLAPPILKNRVLKMDFFSPVTGNLTFGYEQVLSNNVTLEGSLGIIGISFIDDPDNAKGLFLKAGPRLYFSPDYIFDGMKRYNDFQGAYFKPEIIYSGFGYDYESYNVLTGIYSMQRGTNNSIALMLNLGKQWVLAKLITLDLHGGIGYGASFYNYDNSQPPAYGSPEEFLQNKYSHVEIPEAPLTFSAGFDIGILLK